MNLNSSFASSCRALFVIFSMLSWYALAAGQQYSSLYKFQGGADGWGPSSFLIADKAGNLYGTTTYGGNTSGPYCSINGCGTVFQLQPPASPGGAWTKTALYNFTGNPDGYWPSSGHLVFDKAGELYGTTQFGGSAGFGYGTIFQLAPPAEQGGSWTETVLYNFTGANDGGVPANGLVADSAGNLYGTTNDGGQYGEQKGAGTAFQLAPPPLKSGAWTETTLFSFEEIKDGNEPNDLTFDARGNLYGTRSADNILCTPSNPRYCGTAFEIERQGSAWRMKILHQFAGTGDGSSPWSGLIFDKKGNLYGTTIGFGGNTTTGGTVFELTPPASGIGSWTETLLYHFSGGADGGAPLADLIFDPAGNLYDTTFYGGDLSCNPSLGCGVVFQLIPPPQQSLPWTETVVHTFGHGSDGQDPGTGLIYRKGGVFYGTTAAGGGSSACNGGCGTVFRIIP
jgi:hypothetical protein